MTDLIIGASSGLGRALAEELARERNDLVLVASDLADLTVMAAHLSLTAGVSVEVSACRIEAGTNWLASVQAACQRAGGVHRVFFPIGLSSDADLGLADEKQTRLLVEANFLVVPLTLAPLLEAMKARGTGAIVGFGSIAAFRGRSANIIYAAAKRALACYFESIRHLTAETKIKVQFYHLGYLDTQQSFGKRLLFPVMAPQKAARIVCRNLKRSGGVFYLPRFWRLFDWGMRFTPWVIFRRLRF